MKTSLLIVAFFLVGLVTSNFSLLPQGIITNDLSLVLLCTLMFSVGIGIGSDPKLKAIFRSLSIRTLLLPLGTTIGTFLGAICASFFIGYSIWHCLAVSAGFAYYSLSSLLIAQHVGPELGTLALISNVLRECLTLLFVPLVAKFVPEQATISMGGATTMDTTLPIIVKTLGTPWAFVAILHAVVLDFSVPFWVLFFCSLGE